MIIFHMICGFLQGKDLMTCKYLFYMDSSFGKISYATTILII
jgi:hypothetical protein